MNRILLRPRAILLFLLPLFFQCREPLVNEEYARNGNASINGLDLFEEILAQKGELSHSAFADPEKLRGADLVVFIQTDASRSDAEGDQIQEILDAEQKDQGKPVDGMKENAGSKEGEPEPESEGEEGETESKAEHAAGLLSERMDSVNLLILQRGVTATPAFWARVLKGLPDDKRAERAREFARRNLENGEALSKIAGFGLFFQRKLLTDQRGIGSAWYHPLDRMAFLFEKGWLPSEIPAAVKILKEDPLDDEAVYRRTIIAMEGGAFFAEASLPRAHLFLISDATPFLNYFLAQTQNRTLLEFVLHRSLKYANPKGKPKILIVDGWNTRQQEMEKERSLLTFLVRPPWNVPIGMLGLLFVLFLWSRWMRDRPVTEAPLEDRDGDMLRHFEGVGQLLKEARQSRGRSKKE